MRLGDPLGPETDMGPVAIREQFEKISQYVAIAQEEGAAVATGGRAPDDPGLRDGYFFQPTVLTDVRNDMRVAQEEIFGPVLAVIPFEDEADVIRQANETEFGLASGIWTTDLGRAHRVAKALRAGTVWVNTYRAIAPAVPFGGYKASGLGRESGLESLDEYLETKSVWIDVSP
jgi:aldehyde dehydrogenase (NAD+)